MDIEENKLGEIDLINLRKKLSDEIMQNIENERLFLEQEDDFLKILQQVDGVEELDQSKEVLQINDVKKKIEEIKDAYINGKVEFSQAKDIIEDLINILLIRFDMDSQDKKVVENINIDDEIINPIKEYLFNEWTKKNNN